MSAAHSKSPFSSLVRNAFAPGGTLSSTISPKASVVQGDLVDQVLVDQVDEMQLPSVANPVEVVEQINQDDSIQTALPLEPTAPVEPVEPEPPEPTETTEPTAPTDISASQDFAQPFIPTISNNEKLDLFDSVITAVSAQQSAEQILDEAVQPESEVAPEIVPEPELETVQPLQPAEFDSPTEPPQPPLAPQPQPENAPQPTSTLNPPNAISSAKEKLESTASLDAVAPDASTGVQYIEQEKNPEIPVEVESFLQHAEDHANQTPQEIVIADGSQPQSMKHLPKKPVFVLPITEETEKEGEKKNPRYSIRWLVEWSHKIIKMFTGKVIYREAPEES
ncbi:MAG: hypothetical protein WAU07_05190 [Microgenomates group bacterium]